MRLEGTLSGSVLSVILCRCHEDSKRKEITMPVFFHCTQSFFCLVILPILVLIQVCTAFIWQTLSELSSSSCRVQTEEEPGNLTASWHWLNKQLSGMRHRSVVSDISSLFSERRSLLRVSKQRWELCGVAASRTHFQSQISVSVNLLLFLSCIPWKCIWARKGERRWWWIFLACGWEVLQVFFRYKR